MHRDSFISYAACSPGLEPELKPEPFLKWAGGKTQLLKQFVSLRLFPSCFKRYYEPCVGSGAVFFHLLPPSAVLNDMNANLIAAYRHIQNQLDELLPLLQKLRSDYHALSSAQQQDAYYRMRERYNQLRTGELEKTALLIVLNKTGYNGLYRENARGKFNVPFGRYTNPTMFREENLRTVSTALQSVDILNMDVCRAVAGAQPEDFVYLDPPYMPISKTSSFTSYTSGAFGKDQQIALAKVAYDLADRGVLVMVSNSDLPFIRELYRDFRLHTVRARRVINSKPDARGAMNELVLTSY